MLQTLARAAAYRITPEGGRPHGPSVTCCLCRFLLPSSLRCRCSSLRPIVLSTRFQRRWKSSRAASIFSDAERTELLPTGKQTRFANRIGWARTNLKKAGLLDATRSSHFRITARGVELLAEKPDALTDKFLRRYPEYVEYLTPSSDKSVPSQSPGQGAPSDLVSAISPLERLADAYAQLRQDAEEQLLAKVKAGTPEFFERLVIDLLQKMRYGGSFRDAAQALGRSGDGGVDGLIKEDVLGLDTIYVQAKRYTTNNIPAGDVRDFVGAHVGKKARKGVFFTTSGFSPDALKYVEKAEGRRSYS